MTEQQIRRVPNQKLIFVNKAICNKAKLYTTINLQCLDNAAKTLTSTAGFTLFVYLAKNQQNYQIALSPEAFYNWCGYKRTAYNSAVAELIEKGYLVPKKGYGDNAYDFRDYGTIEIEDTHPTAKLKVDDGFRF